MFILFDLFHILFSKFLIWSNNNIKYPYVTLAGIFDWPLQNRNRLRPDWLSKFTGIVVMSTLFNWLHILFREFLICSRGNIMYPYATLTEYTEDAKLTGNTKEALSSHIPDWLNKFISTLLRCQLYLIDFTFS